MKALHDCDKKVSFSTNKLDIGGGMYIYMYVHAYIYFSLFLQFLFLRLQFVMWQKTFLLSMLSLELLASSFFLIKLRWCAVNFLLFQWRID